MEFELQDEVYHPQTSVEVFIPVGAVY